MTAAPHLSRWVLAGLLIAGSALGQERSAICDRGDGFFYGQPITLEQLFLIPGNDERSASFPLESHDVPMDGLPVPPSGDPLFPDPGGLPTGPGASCEGGSIVGVIDCIPEAISSSGSADAPLPSGRLAIETEAFEAWVRVRPEPTPEGAATTTDPDVALATADPESALPTDPATATPPPPRVVRQLMILRPVLVPGAPGRISFEPVGDAGIEAPPDLTEAEIQSLATQIADRNAALFDFRGELSVDTQDGLIRGLPVPVPLPGLPEGMALAGDPGVLAMGLECGAQFRAMLETDRLLKLRAEKAARIKRLKEMLKAEREKAGLLGLVWDSEAADRLERIIAYEEGNLAKIDAQLAEHKATIDRRKDWLSREDRSREIAAIKADPDRLKAETERRRAALIEAARDKAKARWMMIEGEAAYARQLAAQDAMIKAARDRGQHKLADKLEEDKARIEAARDSWRTHAQSMIDVRTREEFRLAEENAADGIGPAMDATSLLLAEGKNPVEVIEKGARDGAREAAERRAVTDARTLGGAATETYDAGDFADDLYQSNLEIQNDPALFFRRYGAYVEGVGQAAYDGVKDIAVIGVEAADLAGEVFESGLSSVTGYEFNTYGHENLDALVAAGGALSETDALKIGELAGKVAEAADRKISRMAVNGEKGIEEALSTTGYIAGSVLGAEELAIAGSLKVASAVKKAARGAETVADVAKVADGVTDASRIADAAKIDAPTVPEVPKVPDSPATPEVPVTPDVPTTPDDPVAPVGDTTKVDPEDLKDTVRIDPPKTEAPATPDPATPDLVDPDKTAPAPPPDPDAPATPDADAKPADPDAVTEPDPVEATTEPTPDPNTVDRDAVTERDPVDPADADTVPPADPDKTAPAPPPDPNAPATPDADGKPADPDAVTEPDPVEATTEPTPDPNTVDRDAVTEREPIDPADADTVPPDDPDKTAPAPAPDPDAPATPDADAKPADPDAVTEPDPVEVDPPVTPLDPANEPLNDPYADTEPPLADTDPPLAVEALPSSVDEANLARGPPDTPRDLRPIDKSKLDGTLDESTDYEFGKPLYDPALIPQGGSFGGEVSFATNAGTTRQIPGQNVTAPDGTLLELGPLVGTGATANVFASKTDPSKVIRLVEFTDPTAGALDAVGRKVGEAIQDSGGNGNFRLTEVTQQFTAIDPATGNKWLVTVEENLAATGQGITNAKNRFAKRPPNAAEELTMALAMRDMNAKGVVWTDHKPANFDIVPNDLAPTGYQMVIFDTGGIRPVTGATEAKRAMTALEVQHAFDSIPFGNSPLYGLSQGNLRFATAHLDDRVFGVDEMGVTMTRGSLNRADGYFELSTMSKEELETYARTILGPDFKLDPEP